MLLDISTDDMLPLYDELYLINPKAVEAAAVMTVEKKESVEKGPEEKVSIIPNSADQEVVDQQLVDQIADEAAPVEQAPIEKVKEVQLSDYLKSGNLENKVYVFLDKPALDEASESHLFLAKVLAAAKLDIKEVALFIKASESIKHLKSAALTQKTSVLYFAETSAYKLPFFEPKTQQNIVFCCAPTIEAIMVNADLKKKLWAVLQKLFL